MRIVNSTQSIVTCNCGEKQVQIMPQQFEEIQFDSKIKISLSKDSYFCNLAGSSKLLKLLSLLSDPFHLQKEYHGVLETVYETEFTSSSTSTLKITEASICVDPKLQLYYDFCELKANDEVYRPISVKKKDMNSLKKVFLENEKKLIVWQNIWDIFIEPIVFEALGLYFIYRLFSLWLNTRYVLTTVCAMIAVGLIIDLLICFIRSSKKKKKRKISFDNFIFGDETYIITLLASKQ